MCVCCCAGVCLFVCFIGCVLRFRFLCVFLCGFLCFNGFPFAVLEKGLCGFLFLGVFFGFGFVVFSCAVSCVLMDFRLPS